MTEVKGLKTKCIYNTHYRILVTCRLKLYLFFFTKSKPLFDLMFFQNKSLNIRYMYLWEPHSVKCQDAIYCFLELFYMSSVTLHAPLHTCMWEWPQRPWTRVHSDYAGPLEGKMFLIFIDAHSKWMVYPTSSSTSTTTNLHSQVMSLTIFCNGMV